jgi:predicted dienelactone hydrolase
VHARLGRRALLAAPLLAAPAIAAPLFPPLRATWRDPARRRDIPVIFRPALVHRPAPTVILSHGLGGTRDGLSWLGEALAEAGYAALQVQHPGSDGAIYQAGANRTAAVANALTPGAALDRLHDVVFAINELVKRTPDFGIDPRRFAVAGHSYGAWTIQKILGERLPGTSGQGLGLPDARVLAGIAMSPSPPMGIPAPLAFSRVATPLLHLTGTDDAGRIEGIEPEARRIPFDAITRAPQVLAVLDQADHFAFAGEGPEWIQARSAPFTQRSAALCVLFLDAMVRGDHSARTRLREGQVRPPLHPMDRFETKGF